ncbi:hypothetical protein [uncultured Comamonas sp.]|uniref:hypothetical protein n=1 Tax=uncultured Comamonas sp. TaxID=114710 RepID=UPI0025E249B9|nr:hypothetical protein [uncultured Comamonas sp.]
MSASTQIKQCSASPVAERKVSDTRKNLRQHMAWAKEAETGKLVFVGELPRIRTGLKCGCVCYGCGEPLEAVNAGNSEAQVTPHFRHKELPDSGMCSQAVTKILLRTELEALKELYLPTRQVVAAWQGLSGREYKVSRLRPARHLVVNEVVMSSDVEAVLLLDDDSQLIVRLSGRLQVSETGDLIPTIHIQSDNPLIASLSPAKLRERLSVLIGEGQWTGPDIDSKLSEEVSEEARQAARNALDWVPEAAVPEIGRTPARETLLHWTAKEILQEMHCFDVPGIWVPWMDSYSRSGLTQKDCEVAGTTLDLKDIRLETRVGRTRPDVLAEAKGEPCHIWEGPLAIEVTVSNHINAERLARIEAENIAFLEVDLSGDDRAINYDLLHRILSEDSDRKRWLFHPGTAVLQRQLLSRSTGRLVTDTARELAIRFEELFVQQYKHPYYQLPNTSTDQALATIENELQLIGRELEKRGYVGADLVKHRGTLIRPLHRLFTMKRNEVVGYRLESIWQVVNAILGDMKNSSSRRFHVHYHLALQAYKPKLDSSEAGTRVKAWRDAVADGCRSPKDQYYPNTQFNLFLGLLFPELREKLQWRPRAAQS